MLVTLCRRRHPRSEMRRVIIYLDAEAGADFSVCSEASTGACMSNDRAHCRQKLNFHEPETSSPQKLQQACGSYCDASSRMSFSC